MNRIAILDVANAELGQQEIAGDEDNPRIVAYHDETSLNAGDDETPWCAAFVNWVLKQAGYQGTNKATARSFLHWGHGIPEPRFGCVVVFKRGTQSWQGHVGFYVGKDKYGNISCLGGNQANRVCVSSYPTADVLGYRFGE